MMLTLTTRLQADSLPIQAPLNCTDTRIPSQTLHVFRHKWTCTENCSGVAGGYASSEEPVFVIPGGNLQAGLVRV